MLGLLQCTTRFCMRELHLYRCNSIWCGLVLHSRYSLPSPLRTWRNGSQPSLRWNWETPELAYHQDFRRVWRKYLLLWFGFTTINLGRVGIFILLSVYILILQVFVCAICMLCSCYVYVYIYKWQHTYMCVTTFANVFSKILILVVF